MNKKAPEAGQGFEGENTTNQQGGSVMPTVEDQTALTKGRPKWADPDQDSISVNDEDRSVGEWLRDVGRVRDARRGDPQGKQWQFSAAIMRTGKVVDDGSVEAGTPELVVEVALEALHFTDLDAAEAAARAILGAVQDARRYLEGKPMSVAARRRAAAHDAYREAQRLEWGARFPQFAIPEMLPGEDPALNDFSYQEAYAFTDPLSPSAILQEDGSIRVALDARLDAVTVDEAWQLLDRAATAIVLAEHHESEQWAASGA